MKPRNASPYAVVRVLCRRLSPLFSDMYFEFLQVMRTGVDLKEGQIDSPDTPVL